MKRILCHSLYAALIVIIPLAAPAGPYPPAADEPGSTAVWKDDPAFIAWAVDHENYIAGTDVVSTWQTPERALGPAVGDSLDIVSLGRGGEITLIFDPPLKDGPDWDFAVFENSFSDTFIELAYIEVSSDGQTFVRFQNDSLTSAPVGGYGSMDPTNVDGYGGKYRQGYGTPFDLANLATHDDVLSGAVKLNAISHVRIVDIIGDGSYIDSDGDIIWDPYPTNGSAGFDLEAVGVRYEKDPVEPVTEIEPPALLSPADGAENVALNPTLKTGPFVAWNEPVGNYHAHTRWQVARDTEFDQPVLDVTSPVSLRSLEVSASTLEVGTSYFWRAKYIDNDDIESEWADAFGFTTMMVQNDLNGNGIPDDQELELTSDIDLNNDGQPDVNQITDQFKVLNVVAGSGQVAVEVSNPNVVIEFIETLDPDNFPDTNGNKPPKMLFGLISFRLRMQNAGDRENMTVYLSEPAPVDHEWVKYEGVRGWFTYDDAIFSPDRQSVTLTLRDGAVGDSDGLEDGVIIDPSGVGGAEVSAETPPNTPKSGSAGISGSSGPGCFISSVFSDSFDPIWAGAAGIERVQAISKPIFTAITYRNDYSRNSKSGVLKWLPVMICGLIFFYSVGIVAKFFVRRR
jgi:hypothetical protein